MANYTFTMYTASNMKKTLLLLMFERNLTTKSSENLYNRDNTAKYG